MKSCGSDCSKPCRKEYLVRVIISGEHCPPASSSPSFHVGISAREEKSVDVEGDEASIGDQGEEVVAC